MATEDSLEAIGRDYAINFGSQSVSRAITEDEWDATYKRPWPFPDKQRAGRCPHGVVPSRCAECSEGGEMSSNREQPADPPRCYGPKGACHRWNQCESVCVEREASAPAQRPAEPAHDPAREALELILSMGLNRDNVPAYVITSAAYEAHCVARAALGPAPLVFPPSPSVHQTERDGEAVQRPVGEQSRDAFVEWFNGLGGDPTAGEHDLALRAWIECERRSTAPKA